MINELKLIKEKWIIADDKITGNRAKKWERGLLTFSLQRKMYEKPKHRWRCMFLKKDAQMQKCGGRQGNYSSTINQSPLCQSLWGSGAKKQAEKSMCSPVYHSKKQLLLKSGKSNLFEKKKKNWSQTDPRNSILVENHSLLLGK